MGRISQAFWDEGRGSWCPARRTASRLLGVVLALLAPWAAADEVVRKRGRALEGTVVTRDDVVVVNPYRSTLQGMTFGLVEVPADEVVEIRPESSAAVLNRAFLELSPDDVVAREALMDMAGALRLRGEQERVAEEILRARPDHGGALARVGGGQAWAARRRGDLFLDLAFQGAVRRALRLPTPQARRAAAATWPQAHGADLPPEVLERMARSRREVVGAVAAGVGGEGGLAYELWVPEDDDPVLPVPLVLALHGGTSRDGPVTGTARDAFELFVEGARRRGWILLAPQATGSWDDPGVLPRLEALLEEILLRFHVDLDRLYLVGQGTGGDGALHLARATDRRFAAVGAAGSFAPREALALATRGVGLWLFHGGRDEVVQVALARDTAERLLKRAADFVYTELPDAGHGLPAEAEEDLYRYLAGQRRRSHAGNAWPTSSFGLPVSAAEVTRLGDPRATGPEAVGPDESPAELLARIARGGPDAHEAGRRLAPSAPGALEAVRAILRDAGRTATAQAAAARWLGEHGTEADRALLADVVRGSTSPESRRAAALALARRGAAGRADDLQVALEAEAARYKRPAAEAPDRVPFRRLADAVDALEPLLAALGSTGQGTEVAASIERDVVVAVLRDARTVDVRPGSGANVAEERARLARAVGRAYGALAADPTLMDLLLATLKREPDAAAAARAGWEEGGG